MKISRDGLVPQLEPVGRLGEWQTRLGGVKRLLQRSNIPLQLVIMANTSIAAWETSPTLRAVFYHDARLYAAAMAVGMALWMVFDFVALIPGEQNWGQTQSQRPERSPLKRDTEAIRKTLESDEVRIIADGGDDDDS